MKLSTAKSQAKNREMLVKLTGPLFRVYIISQARSRALRIVREHKRNVTRQDYAKKFGNG